jgi:hypothetical protein
MNRRLWIAILSFTAFTVLTAGWYIEHRRTQNTPAGAHGHSIGNAQSTQAAFDCEDAPDDRWHTVQTFAYQPIKTLYIVAWELCPARHPRPTRARSGC